MVSKLFGFSRLCASLVLMAAVVTPVEAQVGLILNPQHTIDTTNTNIDPATKQLQATANTSLATISGAVSVDGSPTSTPVTVQPSPLSKYDTVVKSAATDRGAVVTTAGTAQTLMAINLSRRGFSIQNQSAGSCYVNGLNTATQDYHSLIVPAASYYETPGTHVGTGAISIVCAVAGASVYAREW